MAGSARTRSSGTDGNRAAGSRRGPTPQFTRAEVLAAARTLVEDVGAQGLTMRRLADELGLSPMALYRYVANKSELVLLLLNESVGSVVVRSTRGGPQSEIVAIYTGMRAGLAEQSWALDALLDGGQVPPAALPLMDRLFGALLACGLSRQRAVAVNRMLWNMMIGDLLARRAAPSAAAGTMSGADPQRLPHLTAVASVWTRSHGSDTFVRDLKTMVAALCG